MRRAAHQMIDRPLVFDDPIAVKLLSPLLSIPGHNYDIKRARHPVSKAFRSFLVARSRYAEEQLALSLATDVRQYVILGAGLDTFAYRNQTRDLLIYEVDLPATQIWKRSLLADAGIHEPSNLTFVPLDLEKNNLATALEKAGFNFASAAFVSWMGVTSYLTLNGFRKTLETLGALHMGCALSFDFSQPRHVLGKVGQTALDRTAQRLAAAGERMQLYFTTSSLENELHRAGFDRWELLGTDDLNARYFADRTDGLRLVEGSPQLATAWCPPK